MHLLPYDPIAKCHTVGSKSSSDEASKAMMHEIMEAVNTNVSASGAKPGIGQTGVHLQYYKNV